MISGKLCHMKFQTFAFCFHTGKELIHYPEIPSGPTVVVRSFLDLLGLLLAQKFPQFILGIYPLISSVVWLQCKMGLRCNPDRSNDFPWLYWFEWTVNPVPVPMENGCDKYYSWIVYMPCVISLLYSHWKKILHLCNRHMRSCSLFTTYLSHRYEKEDEDMPFATILGCHVSKWFAFPTEVNCKESLFS